LAVRKKRDLNKPRAFAASIKSAKVLKRRSGAAVLFKAGADQAAAP